jgi:hypothetical protein
MPRLEVITSRGYWKRIKWLLIGLSPFALLAIVNAIDIVRRHGDMGVAYGMIGISVFLLGAPFLFVLARRFWVQFFDEQGVVLRNGRRFLWSDFVKCEPRLNTKLRIVNNYDLVFKTGTAGVYHLMAENYGEVMSAIQALEAGRNPFVE